MWVIVSVVVVAVLLTVACVFMVVLVVLPMSSMIVMSAVTVMVVVVGCWLGKPHQGQNHNGGDIQGGGVVEQVVGVDAVKPTGDDGRCGAEHEARS